ncbi:unnamed protein product, partial [Phaeothamnion confervicola]
GGCCAYSSVVGRDGLGALWTAWYSNSTGATGLYVAQLDPVTGVPLAPAQLVPGSTTQINDLRPGLACRPAAAGCRVVFSTGPITEPRLASWAPGEAVATPIVAGGARIGAPNARYAAAFRADGRLWVAWHEEGSARATGYYVALTDTSGRRGTATAVGAPPGSSIIDYDIQALPVGSDVLLV